VKQGFFLLEALCACALLTILAGGMMHHYGQWFAHYTQAIEQSEGLSTLIKLMEQESQEDTEAEGYTLLRKAIILDNPSGYWGESGGLPPPKCRELILTWQGKGNHTASVSLIAGDS